jgi:hypothetical protein
MTVMLKHKWWHSAGKVPATQVQHSPQFKCMVNAQPHSETILYDIIVSLKFFYNLLQSIGLITSIMEN